MKALCAAYARQLNFRQCFRALACVLSLGTPHSAIEDEKWQNAARIVQGNASLWRTKKHLMDPRRSNCLLRAHYILNKLVLRFLFSRCMKPRRFKEVIAAAQKDACKWDISEAVDPGISPVRRIFAANLSLQSLQIKILWE